MRHNGMSYEVRWYWKNLKCENCWEEFKFVELNGLFGGNLEALWGYWDWWLRVGVVKIHILHIVTSKW